jgi:ABC-type glycerol-3-phosphate transport system substrate-binding protein
MWAEMAVVAAAAVLISCGQGGKQSRAQAARDADARDLGGIEVILSNWWADWDIDSAVPGGPDEERVIAWRKELMKRHNFTVREANIGDFGRHTEIIATSIMAGDPVASLFLVEPNWAMALYRQGLLAPISDVPGVDFSQTEPVEWNRNNRDAFTFNDKVYGFSVGYDFSSCGGVFFNKRLFQEAGLNPDLPYDLEKSGQWTWETFLDLCKKLTRDINNDGIVDIYALATQDDQTLDAILASNSAHWVDKDPVSGRFMNATRTPAFLEALQYCIRLNTEGYRAKPWEGAEWNFFEPLFLEGRGAMLVGPQWRAGALSGMADDWGFVLFPQGPHQSNFRLTSFSNVYVLPGTFSAEEQEKIMTAYQYWMSPYPGGGDPDTWKEGQYAVFRDSRAIDETLTFMRDHQNSVVRNIELIPGLSKGDIIWSMWVEGADPVRLIESIQPSFDAIIDEFNRSITKSTTPPRE